AACTADWPGDTPLISRKLLFAPAERARVTVSYDGDQIAYLAPVDGVLNLWHAPLADLGKARALTRFSDRDLFQQVWWTHDSRYVVFFREQGGDENWQAHRVDVASGDIR